MVWSCVIRTCHLLQPFSIRKRWRFFCRYVQLSEPLQPSATTPWNAARHEESRAAENSFLAMETPSSTDRNLGPSYEADELGPRPPQKMFWKSNLTNFLVISGNIEDGKKQRKQVSWPPLTSCHATILNSRFKCMSVPSQTAHIWSVCA